MPTPAGRRARRAALLDDRPPSRIATSSPSAAASSKSWRDEQGRNGHVAQGSPPARARRGRGARVECRQRLVEQQRRPGRARVRGRERRAGARHRSSVGGLARSGRGVDAQTLEQARGVHVRAPKRTFVERAHVREQRVVLEDETPRAAVRRATSIPRSRSNQVSSCALDAPVRGPVEARRSGAAAWSCRAGRARRSRGSAPGPTSSSTLSSASCAASSVVHELYGDQDRRR